MINRLKPKSEFSRNVLTLIVGTTIAQAIPIAISPILTRLYSPEDFGIFALFVAIVSVLSVFTTGKYELAIMLPNEDEEAFSILILSITIAIIVSLIIFIFILIFYSYFVKILNSQEIANWLYFIPFSIFISSLFQGFNYWTNRKKDYRIMSKNMVMQSLSNATLNTSFGFLNFTSSGLIMTNIITNTLSSTYMISKNIQWIKKYKIFRSYLELKDLSLKYKQFPLHTLPQNFIYQGVIQLPVFFIKTMFSTAILGFYSLAYRIIGTPISIVSNSFGKVYYQKASILYNKDRVQLYKYTKKMFFGLLILSLSIGGIIVWFLPDLFSFIFGSQWKQAGIIAQYLMIYFIFSFAVGPFTQIYLISKHNLFYLKWEILRFVSITILLFILFIFNITDSNIFFILFGTINLFLYIYIAIPILNNESIIWRTMS